MIAFIVCSFLIWKYSTSIFVAIVMTSLLIGTLIAENTLHESRLERRINEAVKKYASQNQPLNTSRGDMVRRGRYL